MGSRRLLTAAAVAGLACLGVAAPATVYIGTVDGHVDAFALLGGPGRVRRNGPIASPALA